MKVNRSIFAIAAVSLWFTSQAQVKNIDTVGLDSRAEMLLTLDTAKQDTDKAMLFTALADAYSRLKPDTALLLANKGLALSDKIRFARGRAYSYFTLAKINQLKGDYPKALELYFKSLKVYDSLGIKSWIASNL